MNDDLITKFRLKIGNPPKRHKVERAEYPIDYKTTKSNYPSINPRGGPCGGGANGRKGGSRGSIRLPSETIDRRKEPSYRASKCYSYFPTPSP